MEPGDTDLGFCPHETSTALRGRHLDFVKMLHGKSATTHL
jgi:hypothetical protein